MGSEKAKYMHTLLLSYRDREILFKKYNMKKENTIE